LTDLSRFRHAVHHRAEKGAAGEGSRRHGRAGADLEVRVPPGTRVRRDGEVVAVLERPGDRVPVARGGGGGGGNRAFRSSTHQAPRETVPGRDGERSWLTLELRLPVDVALVGLPNAGKSALLSALTGASAVIAPYPHSTVEPAFGPLEADAGEPYPVAALPGLPAGGAAGGGGGFAGRDGHLEQVERARVLVHCLDAADPEPASSRLERARAGLADVWPRGATEIVVATRVDGAPAPPEADLAVDAP